MTGEPAVGEVRSADGTVIAPGNLTASLDGLSRVLPHARRVVLRGTGHTAPDNSGQPDRVAAELRRFFSA